MTAVHNPGRFLGGVAGVIRNGAGQYLMLRRSAQRDFNAGVWECVTGRVNQGESYEQALHREVLEETGMHVRIDVLMGLSWFYRGAVKPENELQGAVFGCSIMGDDTVHHGAEHAEYVWADAQQALGMLTAADAGTRWFKQTIERAEALYRILPDGWAAALSTGVTLGVEAE